MAEVCAEWPGAEPARSVVAVLEDLLEIVAARTGSGVEGTVHARRRGTDRFVGGAGARAARGELAAGAGPWRSVLDAGEPVVLPDLRSAVPGAATGDASWWRPVLDDGFRCVVAVPAALSRGGSAALTLFLEDAGAAGPEVVRRAEGFAEQVASLIDLHSTIPARDRPSVPGGAAGRTRATVDHAVGVLMEARGCDEDAARRVLQVLSADQGRPLEVVALSVVQHAVRRAADGRVLPARRA